ncbi:MAG: DUF4179 domain-containing protein [Lachnospiraceae bacterium]|nr:DUF4179 domain-containing protein [Lachnospiraceae bacterium]
MKMEFQNIPVSEKLDQVVENSLEQVYTQSRRSRAKSWAIKGGAIAATFVMGAFVCISNPSIAAGLPFVGHIFERLDKFAYPGDYSEVGEPLEADTVGAELDNSQSAEEMEAVSEYTKTVDGMTITLSEVYCNAQALNITVQIKSEEPLPETSGGFYCYTSEKYSFTPSVMDDVVYIKGEMIDAYTYAGVMRFDLNERAKDDSALQEVIGKDTGFVTDAEVIDKYVKDVVVPENFTLHLIMTDITGDLLNPEPIDYGKSVEELNAMSEKEWHDYMVQYENEHPDLYEGQSVSYKGTWDFELDITMDNTATQVVELNDYNELGIGFEKVVKDRFEITMYDAYKDESKRIDYFPVMLDADGILMDYGSVGGLVNTVAINGRDVSKVDIFLIDWDLWMEELKGDKWRQPGAMTEDGRTYRELLLEKCAYHKEVVFE